MSPASTQSTVHLALTRLDHLTSALRRYLLMTGMGEYYSYSHLAELASEVSKYAIVNAEQITFTNGSMGALELIFNKVLSNDKKSMLGIGPQFVEAVSEFKVSGGSYSSLNMFDYADEESLFLALQSEIRKQKPTLVYIDNPNNPTGRIYARQHLVNVCKVCREVGAILLVDEAYGEFIEHEESMLFEAAKCDNLLVLRSFSKGMGLAGIRLGYVVSSPSLSKYLHSSVVPFGPSLASIKIAKAILPDIEAYLAKSKFRTRHYKLAMMRQLEECGFEVMETSPKTPILLVKKSFVNLAKLLDDNGIMVASGSHFKETNPQMDEQYARIRIVGNDQDLWQFQYRLRQFARVPESTTP